MRLVILTVRGDAVRMATKRVPFALANPSGTPWPTLSSVFEQQDTTARDMAVITTGLYDTRDGHIAPIGWFVADRKVDIDVAPYKPGRRGTIEGGMLIQEESRVRLVRYREFGAQAPVVAGIYSKPILVMNARNDGVVEHGYASDRIAIGRRADSSVVVALVYRHDEVDLPRAPITQQSWADFLARPSTAGGVGLVWALGLDGGAGAHIFVPRMGHFGAPGTRRNVVATVHLQRAP